jgi:hypothetical protein
MECSENRPGDKQTGMQSTDKIPEKQTTYNTRKEQVKATTTTKEQDVEMSQ